MSRARARRARPQRPEASDEEIAALRAELQSRLDHLRALFNKDRRAAGLPDDVSGVPHPGYFLSRSHKDAEPTASPKTGR